MDVWRETSKVIESGCFSARLEVGVLGRPRLCWGPRSHDDRADGCYPDKAGG